MMKTEYKFLLQVILTIVLMQGIAVIFIFWIFLQVFSEKKEEYKELVSGKARLGLESIFSGALDDVYIMNNRALNVRMDSSIQNHIKQNKDVPICVSLTARSNMDVIPFINKKCSSKQFSLDDPAVNDLYEKTVEEIYLSAGEVVMLSIKAEVYLPKRYFYSLPENFWRLMFGGSIGILVISIMMTVLIYKRILYKLIEKLKNSELEEKTVLIERSLLKEKRNLRIVQSLQKISDGLVNNSLGVVEEVFIRHIVESEIFSNIIFHSKSSPCDVSTKEGYFLNDSYEEILKFVSSKENNVAVIDIGKDINFPLHVNNPGVTGYIISLHMSFQAHPLVAWIDDNGNEVDELIYSYFTNIARQYERHKTFVNNITQDAMETIAKISLKDGKLPISSETVYVEYIHPEALIYSSRREEVKKRVSLSRLMDLFPQILVQINKSCLVNPHYIVKGSLEKNMGHIRVRVGRSITRLKVGKTYLYELQKHLGKIYEQ